MLSFIDRIKTAFKLMERTFSLMFAQGKSYWLIALFTFALNFSIVFIAAVGFKEIIKNTLVSETIQTEHSTSIKTELTPTQAKALVGGFIFFVLVLAFIANINRISTQRFTRDILLGKKGKFSREWMYSFRFTLTLLFWLLIQSTIGLILGIIRGSSEPKTPLGYFLNGLRSLLAAGLSFTWNTATFFVTPFIVFEDTGAWEAVKKSTELMKESFGESITANFSFGWINAFTTIFCIGLGHVIPSDYGFLIALILAIYLFTMTWLAQEVFRTILYLYVTGQKDVALGHEFAEISFVKKGE